MVEAAGIAFAPALPWSVLVPLFVLAALTTLWAVFRRARGWAWRALAMAALAAALLNPALVEEERTPITDVAVIVVDRSPSQEIDERTPRTEAAAAALADRLARFPDLEVRTVEAGAAQGIDETRLFEVLTAAVSDVPRRRLAGAVLITDGQVHDAEGALEEAGTFGPIHTLLTGERGEGDRRLVVAQAPAFALVGRPVMATIRVDDLGAAAAGGTARVTMRQDGGEPANLSVPVGRDFEVEVTLGHGGTTILEFEVEAGPRELTLANNHAALAVNGVRDRLRVLLVSGEPHPGERTWRNILKSDPSVDLVHFTILRPPEKQDGTPINELSLISFPIRELFELRLTEFDLIIFDRYRRRGVLPNLYLANIAQYVNDGGAFLEASGPQFAGTFSLFRTPLGAVLPGEPTGEVVEEGFLPALTDLGRRHPVTAGLDGGGGEGRAPWGRWFRQIGVIPTNGSVLMDGAGGRPLLILDRVGEGRVGQLMSDHIWLWARGLEGGGPQAELLRRMAHWLMKEPELEENDLKATVTGNRIDIIRRSLEPVDRPVEVTTPSEETVEAVMEEMEPGLSVGHFTASEPGIFRIEDGAEVALAVVGALNPPELADVRTSEAALAPVVEASGGSMHWLVDEGAPSVRRVAPGRDAGGRGWIGLRANGDYDVTGLIETPLLPAPVALLVILGCLMAGWRREGR
jgi:hypothetical protein